MYKFHPVQEKKPGTKPIKPVIKPITDRTGAPIIVPSKGLENIGRFINGRNSSKPPISSKIGKPPIKQPLGRASGGILGKGGKAVNPTYNTY